jgi:hypothetical protein
MRALGLLGVLFLVACEHPGRVEYAGGQCIIDGQAATLVEVESRQAKISERIVARQPISVAVTILIVLLAGASHIEKLILLFSTRRKEAHSLGDRIRNALDRYRAHPMRYFAIVVGTLLLLGCAGGAYVSLDASKRADERALGLLQFCHVALRNRQADAILDEQKKNLSSIEDTAGAIRTLVGGLPPEEQKKARQIVEEINGALAKQGRLVNELMTKSDETTRAALERGLGLIANDFESLKGVPSSMHDLADAQKKLEAQMRALEAKPFPEIPKCPACPQCPACVCERPRPVDGGQ